MQRNKKNETASKREQKSKEIASLEQERDEFIDRKLRIEKEIGTIYPEEANGRLRGMRLQTQSDTTQEHIDKLYKQIAKALIELAEIEKQARLTKREYYITATGNRHLKAEARKAEIQRTLKELAPSRKATNIALLCSAMEAEYEAIDSRSKLELHNFSKRYIDLMGVPIDAYEPEAEAQEIGEPTPQFYTQGQGRPRTARRYPGALDAQ